MYDDLVVDIHKTLILNVLRANRDAHRAIFVEALGRYHELLEQTLATRIEAIRERPDKPVKLLINLPTPEDHTRDYDRVIAMIERHQGQTVSMSEQKYANYMDDEWDWTRAWAGTTKSYVSGE
jgi:hypothetical protein